MWRRAGAPALVVLLAAALVVSGANSAAAAPELRLSPASGPPGSTVTVQGTGFPADRVEIRWANRSGALLGEAMGPDFSVTTSIPEDAAANSVPIVAVVQEGSGVLTSNASFQVTPTSTTVPVDTTVPVETTVTTTPAPAIRDTGSAPARGGGVDGGADPVMTATAEPTPQSSSPTTAPGAAATAGATVSPGASVTTTTAGPGGPGPTSPASPAPTAPPVLSAADAGAPAAGVDDAGRALGPAASSQSSGLVRSPGLLLAGLGLTLAGVVILFVRNRHRLGS